MKKYLSILIVLFISITTCAIETPSDTTINLKEVSITSLYRNNVNVGYLLDTKTLISKNYGQEPSNLFATMPNIFAMSDNGTEFGYGYFRIRGLDQTRINVMLDGMPWNEAEDYGVYFANSPDLMSSMHSIKVERGTSSSNNGTASSGGSINLESVNLLEDTTSYAYIGGGSFNTYKTSIIYNSGLFGKSAIHVKATQQQTDGYRDNSFNNSQAFTVKYGYFFNDNHNIEILSMNGRHRNGQGWIGNTEEELSTNKHANGNLPDEDDEWFQSINKIQYKGKLDDNTLFTSSAYLQYQKGCYNMDLDNYMTRMEDPTWAPTNTLYSYGLKHFLYGGNAALKYYGNDFTITGGTNIYAYTRDHYMDSRLDKHFKNVDSSEYYDNTGFKLDYNIYGAGTYTVGKFNFGANIQYRYVCFDYEDNLDKKVYFNNSSLGTVWRFVNWGANTEYNISNQMKLYVRYSEVSREPTRTDMFGGSEIYPGVLTTTKAERSHDIETGYEISTKNVKANVNLYYMRFSNERVLNGKTGINALPLHDTADKSYRMGVEGSVDWNISNLHIAYNVSWSRNRIDTETFKNKNHILTPSLTLNNDIYYQTSNWKAGLGYRYRTKMYIDQNNDHEIPEYLTFNAYGSYKIANVEFGARINNIFNRTNYYNATEGATGLLWFREAGTNIGADIKYYF